MFYVKRTHKEGHNIFTNQNSIMDLKEKRYLRWCEGKWKSQFYKRNSDRSIEGEKKECSFGRSSICEK